MLKKIIIFLLISILFINKSMQDIVKCFECETQLSTCLGKCFSNPATVIRCGEKCEEDHLACLETCVNETRNNTTTIS